MSQALFTSMTGLNSAQQSISVVSNNVANINTTAYKSADARFATLFSNTLTAGNAPTATAGGTNPKQIGLGVKLEGIVRNFETGPYLSTGRTGDSMISGRGYYTVMDPSGAVYLTRDGSFTLDAKGNMVTLTGNKVLGASSLKSEESSTAGIHVPQNFTRTITGDDNIQNLKIMSELNNSSFTTGKISMTVSDGANEADIEFVIGKQGDTPTPDVIISETTTVDQFMTQVVNAINDKANAAGVNFKLESKWGTRVNQDNDNTGKVIWSFDGSTTKASLKINDTSTANLADGLSFYELNQAEGDGTAMSKALSYQVDVNPTTSPSNMTSLKSYSIGADGTIEATYDNGDKLTVFLDDANEFQYQYVTSTGVYISGTSNDTTSPVTVNPLVASKEGLVLQIASVTNEEGLVSNADNLWAAGPDSGKITFTIAGQMGTGNIVTNGLESSNVDLARELSNMIIAQRAINANSRVFSTASTVLETLSQLGR